MSGRIFMEMLRARWAEGKFVCVGLDSELGMIPEAAKSDCGDADTIFRFSRAIVESTMDIVCAYKLNFAFYAAEKAAGLITLESIIRHIHEVAPGVPVILDIKDADIGNSTDSYARMAFEWLEADAITTNPYLGAEPLAPFLKQADKGIFVLCRTSNTGSGEFQSLPVNCGEGVSRPFYQVVAKNVAHNWNTQGNCGLVVGATYPGELQEVRSIVGNHFPILIPAIGAQGGDLERTVMAGHDSFGRGIIINSSRSIIFASNGPDFADVARRETEKLHRQITEAMKNTPRMSYSTE